MSARFQHRAPQREGRAAQSFLVPVIALDHRLKTQDPSARYIGVGVTQGNRPDAGANIIAVVVVAGLAG